ncbi:hypothetical protein DXB23_05485 [Dorea sp. OM02-2LB]|nr:hypothetical protein DXB23_05485 [Dorea sp. OM02-2LB]
MFSEECKKMIKSMNQDVKNVSVRLQNMFQENLQLSSSLSTDINTELLNRITEIKSQMYDFSRVSKQLSELIPSFQLSEEVLEFIKETKKSESLSEEEFEKRYGEELEVCKLLGTNGWVVSVHSNPRYIKNWYKKLIEGESDKIVCFFEEDDRVIRNIMDTLERKYNDPVNRNYYSRGIRAFQSDDYMTSAMYLVGLLESRVNALVQFPPKSKYREKFSDKGFGDVKQEKFAESNSFFTKRYYFLDVYPSLISFLNRLFVDGEYTFENGVEPPYINRNWLLHGKCCREIERFECIQLLNALETIENVLGNKREIED